ncbi:MAG TPA: helix-turn-helix domain-containing protein [Mucilaginibacter sp.]|jgi:hypothetical protein
MLLKSIIPYVQLAPFIRSFWIFESDYGHPVTSSRIIAPNACVKIVLPFENNLVAESQSVTQHHPESRLQFIGNADEPYVVSTSARRSGTLIIELTPQGACHFAPFSLHEVTNNIVPFASIYGNEAVRLEERLANTPNPVQKAVLLQDFLVKKLGRVSIQQEIVDFAVSAITSSTGQISIRSLEHQTGYSRRYLDILFLRYVGISPKTLASISRFQHFHLLWAKNPTPDFYRDEIFRFYHDQSHFIKEFKRFSGYSPKQYGTVDNEFGRLFYQDYFENFG